MAQRTIHYLIGELFLSFANKNSQRFRLGNLLPDAHPPLLDRKASHYPGFLPDGSHYCDLQQFEADFGSLPSEDDLYLGYYLHLLTDIRYRMFTRREFPDSFRWDKTNAALLHQDYHLLNSYIVRHFGLIDQLQPLQLDPEEPVFQLYPFDIPELCNDLKADFSEDLQGNFTYLTVPLLQKFLDEAVPFCQTYLTLYQNEHFIPDGKTLSW